MSAPASVNSASPIRRRRATKAEVEKRREHRYEIVQDMLRRLVEMHIQQHLPADQLKVLQAAEASERDILKMFAKQVAANG